jgi:hypothetical protein
MSTLGYFPIGNDFYLFGEFQNSNKNETNLLMSILLGLESRPLLAINEDI